MIHVVFIAGAGRSGSTLLGRMLGELPGCLHVGEASWHLYNAVMLGRSLPCGCGSPVDTCEFWAPLVKRIDVEAVAFGSRYGRLTRIPSILMHDGGRTLDGFDQYARSVLDLYLAASERLGVTVVIDSSKNGATGLLLNSVGGMKVTPIHLVRDPRGVVSSWSRPKAYLRAWSPARSSVWWLGQNLGAEVLCSRIGRGLMVRYEELIRHPTTTLDAVIQYAGLSGEPGEVVHRGRARLRWPHSVGGNPSKGELGDVSLRDSDWSLSKNALWVVRMLTGLAARRYGYLQKRESSGTDGGDAGANA